jgi:hypothetical protein
MKHYLTETEFKEILLKMEIPNSEISFGTEDEFGHNTDIYPRFRMVNFLGLRVFLYNYPSTPDVGLLQEDSETGWDEPIHDVYQDFIDCGYRLFVK